MEDIDVKRLLRPGDRIMVRFLSPVTPQQADAWIKELQRRWPGVPVVFSSRDVEVSVLEQPT